MRIVFDRYEMDLEQFELWCDGTQVKLEPQVFDLLAVLVRNAGKLVTRDELVETVWHGRIVSEATIDARVASARRAVDDDGKRQRFIKTVPRRGFRFRAKVDMVEAETSQAEPAHEASDMSALPAAAPRPFTEPVVAILPFRDLSTDTQSGAFAEGVSEDITTALSRFHALRVTSRMSSFQFRGTEAPPKEVAGVLGADFLLSGTVRRSSGHIRVVVELFEAKGDHQIWSDSYDRLDTDIFAVQDEISRVVASSITGQVEFSETRRMRAKGGQDLTAYEALLEGLDLHKSGVISQDTASQAVAAFTKAIETDPDFARAYAWRACSFSRTWGFPVASEEFESVASDVFKALALDPSEAEAHRIAGAVCRASHEFEKSTYHIERSLELNPSDAHIAVKAAEHFALVGQSDRARKLVEQAMVLNPLFPPWYWEILALTNYVDGKFSDAISAIDRVTNPTFAGFAYKAAAAIGLGRLSLAKQTVSLLRETYPEIRLAVYRRNGRRFAFLDEDAQTAFIEALAMSGLE